MYIQHVIDDVAETIKWQRDTSVDQNGAGPFQALTVDPSALPPSTPGVPTGSVIDFAGSAAPADWLLCDGSAYDTTTYADLFAVIGYTYGGAGASFNVPDCRQRVSIAKWSTGALGQTGGSFDHNHTVPTHQHSVPNHTHSIPNHTHTTPTTNIGIGGGSGGAFARQSGGSFIYYSSSGYRGISSSSNTTLLDYYSIPAMTTSSSGPGSTTASGATTTGNNNGSGVTGTNNQAYIVLNKIIKT